MGQKVNPNGIRLGINKTWSSRWFSKSNYSKLLHEDLEIKKYVQEKLKSASISKITIERAAKLQIVKKSLMKHLAEEKESTIPA